MNKGSTTSIPLKIYLIDTPDQVVDITCDAPYRKALLPDEGFILYTSNPQIPTFSQIVCRELFDMLINPYSNTWAMSADNTIQYEYNVSNPVELNYVTVHFESGIATKGVHFTKKIVAVYTRVGLSDWVLPKWFNTRATTGPFNHTNTLHDPFTLDKNGYAIYLTGNSVMFIFEKSITEERKTEIIHTNRSLKRYPQII